MSVQPVRLDSSNFDQEVINSSKTFLVDFWAPWCAPCRILAPVLEQLAKEMDGRIFVGKVNTDTDFDIALKYGVSSIPTLVLFKQGKEYARLIGLQTKKAIIKFIKENV